MSENPAWLLVTSAYALMSTWVLCLFAARVAARFRLLDRPSDIKLHRKETPLMGGAALLAVIIPIMPVLMVFFEPAGLGNYALSIIAVVTILCALIGISDDRHNLSALIRLVLVTLIFAAALALEHRFLISDIRITGWGSSIIFPPALAWIVSLVILLGYLNSVNMADGKNGLVIGLSLVWTFFLTVLGPPGQVIVMLPLMLMLCVLLIFNLSGQIFLGDGGSYGLAAFFALISIYSYNMSDGLVMADTLVLLFLVPGLDMVRLFVDRLRSGRSPLGGDRDHAHHHLLNLFGWPRGLLVYLIAVSVPPSIALIWPLATPYLIVIFAMIYVIFIVSARRVIRSSEKQQSA